ncbi:MULTISPECIES: DUF4870 domain-containing protein [unclassified Microbacterium]|uniref:DUF4870 domain-containing protein n=1 Tax=unclassified Microbacterium TaxID=2609290 RepID=UPI000EA97A8F|nr:MULTISPECIES: DUF4870 domain-containing protein [unclassified Microbacterium]MBT2485344.1 DUF4870 domain-containing protein [Microbacterium sp. ISL-108]RKN68150.1 DUF4870 domain-containing protein [Microbacterium sp. CGR2]
MSSNDQENSGGYAPPQAPGYTAPPAPGDTAPPPPGYTAPPATPAPGYAAPPAPGYAAPPAPGYAPPPAPGYAPPSTPGYAPPGYGAPAAAPQMYSAPGYPAPVPARGLLPWVLGFLILVPFPFLGGIASGIAMAASGGSARRAGGPASENARAALNWGLTYLMVSTLLLILHFVVLFSLTADSPATGFYPLGIPITLYFAVSVVHLVLVIVGTVRVSSGKVMRVPFAIPFVRA